MAKTGAALLQDVAERILVRWLERQGRADVRRTSVSGTGLGQHIDIAYAWQGGFRRVLVKPDPYCGTDPTLISDRSLNFYRSGAGTYGLEAIADSATRQAGWAVESGADEIHYYFLALAQPEAEVAALASEPDEVFYSELKVGHDDLVIIPARGLHTWFNANAERYASRPVMGEGSSSWYRMVPRIDLERGVQGVRDEGSVFATLTR